MDSLKAHRFRPLLLSLLLVPLTSYAQLNPTLDSDNDGLTDVLEALYGTDPGIGVPGGGWAINSKDTDGDGLYDGQEVLELRTDPLAPDTDGDGHPDGVEYLNGTDPLFKDFDFDGLDDDYEALIGTDPTLADTDGDGLSDFEEVRIGTDPLSVDSDGDGINDGVEVMNGTDPLFADSDGDGLENAFEGTLGTDPNTADTDGDGAFDGAEYYGLLTDPLSPSFASDPGTVSYADPNVNGAYEGLVFSAPGKVLGKLTVKVNKKGTFSGSLQGIGSRGSLRGAFDALGDGDYNSTSSRLPGVTAETMHIVEVAPGEFQIQGQFASPAGDQFFILRRPGYGKLTGLNTPLAGTYTFAASASVAASRVTGDLVGTMKITAAGKISAKVYLPDKQIASWSGNLQFGDIASMFASAGGKTVAAGSLIFPAAPSTNDIDGQIRLVRLASGTKDVFSSGYDQTRILRGSALSSAVLLGLPTFNNTAHNAVGEFIDGPVDTDYVVATLAGNGKLSVPRNSAYRFSGKYAKATGLMSATYSLTDRTRNLSNAKVFVRAVPLQKQGEIAGHYYLPIGGGRFDLVPNSTNLPPESSTITPRSMSVTGDGASYDVSVTSTSGWAAEVLDDVSWVTLSTSSGGGNGLINITVQRNDTGLKREALVRIADQIHFIRQDAKVTTPAATLSISPVAKDVYYNGAFDTVYTISVTTTGSWTASVTGNPDWVTITPENGTGNGTITVTVSPNLTYTNRTATIMVNDVTHVIRNYWYTWL